MPIKKGIYYFLSSRVDNPYPPVVLIHGAGGSHLSWGAEVRRLTGRDVYALDLPGHGKSAGHGEQSLSAFAQQVEIWMDALRLNRAVLIGHSMGGGIVIELALRSPQRAAALGLISTGARLPVREDLLEYAANPATFQSALEILRARAFGPQVNPRLADMAIERLSGIRPSVLYNDYLACSTFDATESLAQITRPALVVCGAEDRLAPLRRSQLLAAKMRQATLRVVPGAGHMLPLEKPGELAEILSEFLARHKSRL